MARTLIPGALVGVAIGLIANIVIGGIFYNLFDGSNMSTLAGTLTASMVGAILGAVAISTANRKDTAVVLRGVSAGAFIGATSGFLGSIGTAELDGIGRNVEFISVVVGAIAGTAGLRGTGVKFASVRDDQADEGMGTLGRALDGGLAGMMIGVACGAPAALFRGSIFLSIGPTYQTTRREVIRVVSLDELLIGGIIGIIIGAVVGLALSRKRVDGLLNFMLVGALVGIVWALPEIIVMTINTLIGGIFGSLVHFGALATVVLAGAVLGASMPDFRTKTPWGLALIGGGIGVVFTLPFILITSALILDNITGEPIFGNTGTTPASGLASIWESFLIWNRDTPPRLVADIIAGASICLIVGTIMQRHIDISVGRVTIGALVAAAIGLHGSYFLFLLNIFLFGQGIELPYSVIFGDGFMPALVRMAINVPFGTLTGLIFGFAMKFAATRSIPDRIPPD